MPCDDSSNLALNLGLQNRGNGPCCLTILGGLGRRGRSLSAGPSTAGRDAPIGRFAMKSACIGEARTISGHHSTILQRARAPAAAGAGGECSYPLAGPGVFRNASNHSRLPGHVACDLCLQMAECCALLGCWQPTRQLICFHLAVTISLGRSPFRFSGHARLRSVLPAQLYLCPSDERRSRRAR